MEEKLYYLLGRVLDSIGFQKKQCAQTVLKHEDETFTHKVQSNGNVVIPTSLVKKLFDIYGLDYCNKLFVHYDPYDAFSFYITQKLDISTYFTPNKFSLCNKLSIGFTNQAQDECMRRLRIKKEAVKLFCGNMPKEAKFKLDTLPGNQLLAIKVNFEI